MLKRVWLILAVVVVAGVQSQGEVCSTLSASVTQGNVDAVRATIVQMVEERPARSTSRCRVSGTAESATRSFGRPDAGFRFA